MQDKLTKTERFGKYGIVRETDFERCGYCLAPASQLVCPLKNGCEGPQLYSRLPQVSIGICHVGSGSKGSQRGVVAEMGREGLLQVGFPNTPSREAVQSASFCLPTLPASLLSLPILFCGLPHRTYMEDYNTGTLPHKKYYDLDLYERKRALKAAKKGATLVCAFPCILASVLWQNSLVD